jgi:Domain of unknown function (DUF6946)
MTTLRRTVHGREVYSFEELVKRIGPDAVASPRRSTVSLVDYWRDPEPRLRDLWEQLRVRQPGDTEMHFEHEVPVQRGRGKSSFTDLMIFADDVAVAIEAKFTEPRYESVATWLGGAPTTNRVDVLEGWLCAIEAAADASIQRDAVRDLPYQLIHRTASVCCVGRRKRLVVYQVFGDSPADYYADDLGRFAAMIAAPERISFVVLGCACRSTDTYARLEGKWVSFAKTEAAVYRRQVRGGSDARAEHSRITLRARRSSERTLDEPQRSACGALTPDR